MGRIVTVLEPKISDFETTDSETPDAEMPAKKNRTIQRPLNKELNEDRNKVE